MTTVRQMLERDVKKGELSKSRIEGCSYQFPSGMMTLIISGQPVHCDQPQTIRSLDACFGGIIEGFGFNMKRAIGKVIYYKTDFMDVMEWFVPARNNPELNSEVEEAEDANPEG